MTRSLTKNNAHFKKAVGRMPLGVSSNFRYWGDARTIYVAQAHDEACLSETLEMFERAIDATRAQMAPAA